MNPTPNLQQARDRLENITTSITNFATSRGAFRTQVLERIAEINRMIPEIRSRIEALKGQAQEAERLRGENDRLTREKGELETRVQTLTNENDRLQAQIQTKDEEIATLTGELNELKVSLNELQGRVAELEANLADSIQANEVLQRQLQASREEVANIKQNIQQLTTDLAKCIEEKAAVENTNRTILAELQQKTAELEEANQLLNTKQQELNNLIQEIQATATAVAQVLAANREIDDPGMTRQLDALRQQFIGLMEQLGMDISRFGRREAAAVSEIVSRRTFSGIDISKEDFVRQMTQIESNQAKKNQIIDFLREKENFSARNLLDLFERKQYNLIFEILDEFELDQIVSYLQQPRTRGGRLKKHKRKTQKKQYKHKYMKGGWVYKGDARLDSESTLISESRSGSKSKSGSKTKSKSGNKRKSVRKLKNKGHGLITRKRKRNRK